MDSKKDNLNSTIRASDINQYVYCSIFWYLLRSGYKPKSKKMENGITKHVELGKMIYHSKRYSRYVCFLLFFGLITFLIFVLYLFYEVFPFLTN